MNASSRGTGASPLLEVRHITKRFGATAALEDVSLAVGAGEITAFLGENGAGKSTLSKVVCGIHTQDSGEILLNGASVSFRNPKEAQDAGIAFIPQELAYAPNLTVAENILLGNWPKRFSFIDRKRMLQVAEERLRRLGIEISLNQPMRELPLADIQLVEIAKAIRDDISLLILDEPTAALTYQESKRLFEVMQTYASSGVGIVLVSHHLDEIMNMTDTVHVFRDGRLAGRHETSKVSRENLVAEMLGKRGQAEEFPERNSEGIQPFIRIRDWACSSPELSIDSADFCSGEVTVLFGLRGSGADAVVAGLAGAKSTITGRLELVGRRSTDIFKTPVQARKSAFTFVPAERRRNGLFMHQSVHENLLGLLRHKLSNAGWLNSNAETEVSEEAIAKFRVRTRSSSQMISELSGGNQQKILIASRLLTDPKVALLVEPTRGVDIGARDEIHRALSDTASGGTTVIVATSDLEEALRLADRLLVFNEGKIVGDLRGNRIIEDAVKEMARGK